MKIYFNYFYGIVTLMGISQCIANTCYSELDQKLETYSLPKLGFSDDGLEPFIDHATVENHHQGHHDSYRKKMNTALTNWRTEEPDNSLAKESPVSILRQLDKVPQKFHTAMKNNGGGYVNHCFYWATMSPNPEQVERQPGHSLIKDIDRSFQGYQAFKEAFNGKALALFGSGYVWLVRQLDNSLAIVTTTNQDSPITAGDSPLLVLDLWEHAYYLKHQYRRARHLDDWWMVVDWEKVQHLDNWWTSHRLNGREEL